MSTWQNAKLVAVHQGNGRYPKTSPFHPDQRYPEASFPEVGESNSVYAGVRQVLLALGMDQENFGSTSWNPLGNLVQPGDSVLLKPNLIRQAHARRETEWVQVVTHGAVVRAVLDYVFRALQGRGRVTIADGPQTDSDFEAICNRTGLSALVEFYRAQGLPIELLDLRRQRWLQKDDVIYERVPLPGDPAGYTTVELGAASEFMHYPLSGRFYGADYDMAETATFHSAGRHAYVLCRTAMDADVVINLPKLKTHKKTGVTLSLKNFVGINGYRNCLPHHTIGTPQERGDEFRGSGMGLKAQSQMTVAFKKVLAGLGGRGGAWARALKRTGKLAFGDTEEVIRSGNWYGNDTAWRMVLDLNKAFFHFDGAGRPRSSPRRYLTLVDGVVAGEGNGPMSPDAVAAGLLVGGLNPLAVDTVCTTLMGFDYRRIPVVARAWDIQNCPLVAYLPEDILVASNAAEWNGHFHHVENSRHLGFRAHFGWTGQIERSQAALVATEQNAR